MHKKLGIAVLVVMILASFSIPSALAKGLTRLERQAGSAVSVEVPNAIIFQAEQSLGGYRYLLEKDPIFSDNILVGGRWNATRRLSGRKSIFLTNWSPLIPRKDYQIIYSPYSNSVDSSSCLGSSPATELEEVHIERHMDTDYIFGLRFLFKRFKWSRIYKSIISLMENSNKTETLNATSVSFYLSIPSF